MTEIRIEIDNLRMTEICVQLILQLIIYLKSRKRASHAPLIFNVISSIMGTAMLIYNFSDLKYMLQTICFT